jgi:hypothetical protein
MQIHTEESAVLVGNRFENPQPGFLAGLGVNPQLKLFNMTRNKFVSTEAGFLDLDPVIYETYTPAVYHFQEIYF